MANSAAIVAYTSPVTGEYYIIDFDIIYIFIFEISYHLTRFNVIKNIFYIFLIHKFLLIFFLMSYLNHPYINQTPKL